MTTTSTTIASSSRRSVRRISSSMALLLLLVVVVLLINPVDSTLGRLACGTIKSSFQSPYGCKKCTAKIGLFRLRLQAVCTLPPTSYDNITTLATPFVGNYYGKGTTSTTKLSIPFNGNYSGYPIPSGEGINITVSYKQPLGSPFRVKTCLVTTRLYNTTCPCSSCGDGASITFNCNTTILIYNQSYPDQITDIYFPDTSTNCFDPVGLLFQSV